MPLWKKIGLGVLGVVVVGVGTLAAVAQSRGATRWNDVPIPDVEASDDPDVIKHGEYLVTAVVHCSVCHMPKEEAMALKPEDRPAMIGGGHWELPMGEWWSPNITPDAETGIADYTDGELYRVLRTGVRKDGRLSILMKVGVREIAHDDLIAIISYIRTLEPVRNEVADTHYNLMGKFIFGGFEPDSSEASRQTAPPSEATIERGEYLADVAMCIGCHSKFDMSTFEITGKPFAGGDPQPDDFDPEMEWIAPNLTPDPSTGWITAWTEDQFVDRFKKGRVIEGSPMLWAHYPNMTETDLRAIFRYLKSLDPVQNDVGPFHRKLGWTPE